MMEAALGTEAIDGLLFLNKNIPAATAA